MTTEIIEFPLTDEIKELGITRIYTGIRDNTDERILLIECPGSEANPLQCIYDKAGFKKTAKELELVLINAGFDTRKIKKFIIHFSKILITIERQQQKTQRDHILEEIRNRRKNTTFS
jgi:hypothetical protein